MRKKTRWIRLAGRVSLMAAGALLAIGIGCAAWAEGVTDLPDRPAVKTRGAEHTTLLDVTMAGSRLVAVGERGIVVLSDDDGRSWRQAKVPTSVSLTSVRFPSPRMGWATGHGGTVLHTEDGGETWTRQLEGKRMAQLALESARAKLAAKPGNALAERSVANAERLVADGPDKPFLALEFADEKTGYVVGAYNLIFRTEDGGRNWIPWLDHVDNPKGMHIYAIRTVGKATYMIGEQGLFLRSLDGGRSFQRLETPYKGTYFAIGALPSGEIVIAGLRGNAYRSVDQGKTFAKVDVPFPVTIGAVTTFSDGRLIFANQAGQLFQSKDGGRSVEQVAVPPVPPVAALTQVGQGLLITAGAAGVFRVPLEKAKNGGVR
ncbi:MAG: YCF48-related protein [Desulfuromonadaceae bacterium]|nr:YCF48-related protein [Desulfuromonadaceae bacterium]